MYKLNIEIPTPFDTCWKGEKRMFKKIKFNLAKGSLVSTMEGKDVSLDEAIRILKDENVISFTATRMSNSEYLKSKPAINK